MKEISLTQAQAERIAELERADAQQMTTNTEIIQAVTAGIKKIQTLTDENEQLLLDNDGLYLTVTVLTAENKQLKRTIESYGKNPAGFDWAILAELDDKDGRIEDLECFLKCEIDNLEAWVVLMEEPEKGNNEELIHRMEQILKGGE